MPKLREGEVGQEMKPTVILGIVSALLALAADVLKKGDPPVADVVRGILGLLLEAVPVEDLSVHLSEASKARADHLADLAESIKFGLR